MSIEASRSGMDLVNNSLSKKYSGAIGPGVYDIHSPLVLEYKDAKKRINQLSTNLGEKYIWVNPDCGLKTRGKRRKATKLIIIWNHLELENRAVLSEILLCYAERWRST